MEAHNKKLVRRAWRILEIAQGMADKLSECTTRNYLDEISIHCEGYSEPGYHGEIAAKGNWNTVTRWNRETGKNETISDLPERVGNLFEKLGIEIEWSDEWSTCSDCGKLVRTNADSYSWTPSYWLANDCEIVCVDCVEKHPSGYLEAHEYGNGGSLSLVEITDIDPEDFDYVRLNEDSYESGWFPGQNDSPQTVAKELEAKGLTRFIFQKDEQSQFYSKWSVYLHRDEMELLAKKVGA